MSVLTQLFKNWGKIGADPKTLVIIILAFFLISTGTIIAVLINNNSEGESKTLADCEKRYEDERRDNRDLTKALLVKNGVIDKLTEEKDSLQNELN